MQMCFMKRMTLAVTQLHAQVALREDLVSAEDVVKAYAAYRASAIGQSYCAFVKEAYLNGRNVSRERREKYGRKE